MMMWKERNYCRFSEMNIMHNQTARGSVHTFAMPRMKSAQCRYRRAAGVCVCVCVRKWILTVVPVQPQECAVATTDWHPEYMFRIRRMFPKFNRLFPVLPVSQILGKSSHAFWAFLLQTNRQTNTGENITPPRRHPVARSSQRHTELAADDNRV